MTSFFVNSPPSLNLYPSAGPLASPVRFKVAASTVSPSLKALQIADVDDVKFRSQVSWLKPRLGMRRNSGIWPPSKVMAGFLAPALAYWPLLPRDAVLPWPLPGPRPTRFLSVRFSMPSMYVDQIHYSATPRSRATSSRVRSCIRPSMVALTRLIGFVLPCTLVRIFWMPQATSTSRRRGRP